ncbi:MAG TPA: VWA domain-containing protein [Acidobacteriota bacterium]|nr:VWA domain-containing protein [Acidobacteriota bacterium]
MRKLTLFSMVALSAAILTLTAAGQDEPVQKKPFYYKIEANRVAIPVYVTDADGKPVTGLGKDDFEVRERRDICRIETVEFIDHTKPANRVYEITPPESRRQFLLIFDLSFSNTAGIRAARSAGIKFLLEQTTPLDLIAVVTLSQRGGVDLLCPFSTQRSQALHSVAGLGLGQSLKYRDPAGFAFDSELESIQNEITSLQDVEQGLSRGGDYADALQNMGDIMKMNKSLDYQRYTGVVTRYIGVLEALATGLRSLHGRKNVIFFSEGFDQKALTGKTLSELEADAAQMATLNPENVSAIDSSGRYGSVALQRAFASLLDEFSRGNSVFYVVDIGRLDASDASEHETRQRGQNTLFQFANETNGLLYMNINNIESILDDIAGRTSASYLVVFEPSSPGQPGEFRKVEISVKNPKLTVNHQEGYFVEKEYQDFTPQEKMIQLSEFISKDLISQRILFDFEPQFFKGNDSQVRIPIILEVDGDSILALKQRRRNDNIAVEIYGYLVDDKNKPLDFFFDIINFSTPDQKKLLETKGIKYYGLLVAPPGRYKIKCLVRDSELGAISSQIQIVQVPNFDKGVLRMSGPIFVESSDKWMNMLKKAKMEATGRREGQPVDYPYIWGERIWTPSLNPMINPAKPELLYIRMYNLLLHPEQNIPQVSMKFEVIDSDGGSMTLKRVSLVDRKENAEESTYDLLFQINLSELDLKPGQHWMRFSITDTLSDNEISSEVPFIISETE